MLEQLIINQPLLSEATNILGLVSLAFPIIGHIYYDLGDDRQIALPHGERLPVGATNVTGNYEEGDAMSTSLSLPWDTKDQITDIIRHTHDLPLMNIVRRYGLSYQTTLL